MKPLLIFDYDGTIHNTMGIYEPAFRKAQATLVSESLLEPEEVSYERIAGWLGWNSVDMWNDFAPQLDDADKRRASTIVGESMASDVLAGKACWYAGAEATLAELRSAGYNMVILSNCRGMYRDSHWKAFRMERFFDEFYGCERFDFAPKTEIVNIIRERFPGDYIMIGDRSSDMAAGRLEGGKFIGCLYGFGLEGELDGSDAFAQDVSELPKLIEDLR